MTRHPKKVNSHVIFKKAKIAVFCVVTVQSGNSAMLEEINKRKDSLQPHGQKKKCLVMISWLSVDDPVDHIFEFSVKRALK